MGDKCPCGALTRDPPRKDPDRPDVWIEGEIMVGSTRVTSRTQQISRRVTITRRFCPPCSKILRDKMLELGLEDDAED
jgi:hypothetical protein